uniref:Uncharacterized protein n=1 Tax=Anguilla anguilla TaxID=7936 RepID=A0A0E9QN86_ANGAN
MAIDRFSPPKYSLKSPSSCVQPVRNPESNRTLGKKNFTLPSNSLNQHFGDLLKCNGTW